MKYRERDLKKRDTGEEGEQKERRKEIEREREWVITQY